MHILDSDIKNLSGALLNCIGETTCAPLAVSFLEKELNRKNFKYVDVTGEVNSLKAGRYYCKLFENMIIAFIVGDNCDGQLKIVSAHIDSPALYIKPNPDVYSEGLHKLNVEVYGGPIVNTWLDRPLSIAGRVVVKDKSSADGLKNILVDFKRPVAVIPNLAVHMNREVNKGVEINKQKELMPVIGEDGAEDRASFTEILAKEICINSEDILDYELYVYNLEEGRYAGLDESLILSPRLDNITSAFAAIEALSESDNEHSVNMAIMYDNEEIGSRTKQGAASHSVNFVINKLCRALGIKDKEAFIMNGTMISVDVAHASHPNYSEKSDPTNHVKLNGGIVIKKACSQSYATDARMSALVKLICSENDIPYQVFVNKSDMPGGSTLGSIASAWLPMRTVDIGMPLLAMHSACETCGTRDIMYMKEFLKKYYEWG